MAGGMIVCMVSHSFVCGVAAFSESSYFLPLAEKLLSAVERDGARGSLEVLEGRTRVGEENRKNAAVQKE